MTIPRQHQKISFYLPLHPHRHPLEGEMHLPVDILQVFALDTKQCIQFKLEEINLSFFLFLSFLLSLSLSLNLSWDAGAFEQRPR
jgi:hypothetical protein